MAVTNIELLSGPFYPNGATTAFGFNFRVLSKPELIVWRGEPGAWVQVDPALYSVNIGATEGGSVVFDAAPVAGAPLYIEGNPDFTQDSAFGGGEAPFTPKAINTELERGALRSAKLLDGVQRAISVPRGELAVDLPPAVQRAGRFLAFGPTGDAIPASGVGADAALRPDLANPAMGSALVAFRQSGAGTVTRSAQDKARETISVIDFGAVGDGVTDDWPAFNAAILAAQAIVQWNGANVAVAAEIVVPYRPAGYVLGSTLNLYPGIILRFLAGSQLISKTHAGDMYLLKGGSQIIGGDHRGGLNGALAGHCFRFENFQGKQLVRRAKADTGWIDEVAYFELNGGSQSHLDNCILTAGAGKFAVKAEDGFMNSAVPRDITNLQTNGGLGIDLGGCNDVMASGGLNGGIRTTPNSRGYHLNGMRVANQATADIDGHGATLTGGWNPVPIIQPGADNIIWNGYCNSGHPIDNSGNARNAITFPRAEYLAAENFPILRQNGNAVNWPAYTPSPDNRSARPSGGRSRAGAVYAFDFYFPIATASDWTGAGPVSIDLPVNCATSSFRDIPVSVGLYCTEGGVDRYLTITGRIFAASAGQGSSMRLYDPSGAPFSAASAILTDKVLRAIMGFVCYPA